MSGMGNAMALIGKGGHRPWLVSLAELASCLDEGGLAFWRDQRSSHSSYV